MKTISERLPLLALLFVLTVMAVIGQTGSFNGTAGQNITSGGFTNEVIAGSITSGTIALSAATGSSVLTLNSDTAFTLAAGQDGQAKTLTFCQNPGGGFNVTPPVNLRGFFTVGTTAGKCNSQRLIYYTSQTAWLATDIGNKNE